jgi:hypothetical protein
MNFNFTKKQLFNMPEVKEVLEHGRSLFAWVSMNDMDIDYQYKMAKKHFEGFSKGAIRLLWTNSIDQDELTLIKEEVYFIEASEAYLRLLEKYQNEMLFFQALFRAGEEVPLLTFLE